MDTMMQDLRNALRTLTRNFGFSAVVILTLALGIGANTAVFTVVNGVLLKPLPYPDPDRLLMLWETSLSDRTLRTVAPANFYDWRQQSHSFEKIASIKSAPGEIDRIEFLCAAPNLPGQKLKSRALFIVARDDANDAGPRLLGIRARYEKAPGPKELIVLDGSAHAQFLCQTDQSTRVKREIVQFLSMP